MRILLAVLLHTQMLLKASKRGIRETLTGAMPTVNLLQCKMETPQCAQDEIDSPL